MTVREAIHALIECKNLDEEFTVEVKISAVKVDEKRGYVWSELGIRSITNCDDIGGGCIATAEEVEDADSN